MGLKLHTQLDESCIYLSCCKIKNCYVAPFLKYWLFVIPYFVYFYFFLRHLVYHLLNHHRGCKEKCLPFQTCGDFDIIEKKKLEIKKCGKAIGNINIVSLTACKWVTYYVHFCHLGSIICWKSDYICLFNKQLFSKDCRTGTFNKSKTLLDDQ